MTKYLNAEEMLNNYEADCEVYENNGDSLDAELWMVFYLKNHSSADVQPVVHAVWEPYNYETPLGKTFHNLQCSNCRTIFNEGMSADVFKYCPMCGAKIGGDEHDNG